MARSDATAVAEIDSDVSQSNTNSASASTTGNGSFIAQAPVASFALRQRDIDEILGTISATFSGSSSFPGGQDVDQTNFNGQIATATSDADSGNVAVTSTGYTTAGGSGVDAASTATANASVDSDVDPEQYEQPERAHEGGPGTVNVPVTVGSLIGPNFNINVPLPVPAFIAQNQDVEQTNVNLQLLAAASEAEAGSVSVTREGDTDAAVDGIDALSNAGAAAEVDSDVNQSNDNSASATTTGDGAFIAQGPVDLSIPFSASFTLPGRIPVTASLSGSLDTSFDGGQDVEQLNVNAQLLAAASSAVAGDVTVSDTGATTADGTGINAASEAAASAKIDSDVTQNNTNSETASTEGSLAFILQAQDVDQINFNGQLLIADSSATAGAVNVTSEGDTSAGLVGINAVSAALATAEIDNSVEQTNDNSVSGTAAGELAPVVQLQEVEQFNVNLQFGEADAEATSGAVYVSQEGGLFTGGDGINAQSNAAASADLDQSSEQSNENEMTAGGAEEDDETRSPGDPTIALQGQLVGQLNLNIQGARGRGRGDLW